MSSDGKVKVLFISGYGRSGSTLLDRILGQLDGFCSVGELRYLWVRGLAEDRLCGCGEPVSQCDFWGRVLRKLGLHRISKNKLNEIIALQKSVDRIRYIPSITRPYLRDTKFEAKLSKYTNLLSQLYHAIQEVLGCQVIVDSSKDPSHGFLLSEISGIDLRIVHLVRDSRAVAYSWRRKKRNLEVKDKIVYMRTLHPATSALMWAVSNTLTELLASRAKYYSRLKYEELVAQPEETIKKVLGRLGFNAMLKSPFIKENVVLLNKTTHNISGNPSKFATGEVRISLDREWIDFLPLKYKVLVTGLTLPWLLKYGYFARKYEGGRS